ncbi:MAG: CCA tRNA nucleotidyltransferase [Epsilonproteobacteria bacterium]|nr:CCA tRNA nucleotidyltransferase [Campylobacterota bacterium]NPA57196.1 CCA tRNA nucleotidyltransferase [Campylobacterota bacterium]
MPVSFNHGGLYPELLEDLPPSLKRELEGIRESLSPYTQRVYLVGGGVRDLLRRRIEGKEIPIVDLDIEIYGIEPPLFDRIMGKMGAHGVGKSFFVYKYREHIDMSLPRIESKKGRGHRGFAVELARDERSASRRRDFTVNALMLDIFTGKLLDFWGGVRDIEERTLRVVDSQKFGEDSLRVLRGVQFAARFGYRIEPQSLRIMEGLPLDDLSHERIFWEFEKLFKGEFLHYGLYYLLRLGIDRKIFALRFRPFLSAAKELIRARRGGVEELSKFYFLYIFANYSHRSYLFFLERLKAPREYHRIFRRQKGVPKIRTPRFLAALSLRFPLKEYLGNYLPDVRERGEALGLWERGFRAVTPKELLQEGFEGEALGRELRRRNLEAIRNRFKGRE